MKVVWYGKMSKYTIKFYCYQAFRAKDNGLLILEELNTTYSNLVEVVGAVKTIFEIYSPIMVRSVSVYENGIPFRSYFRGEF